MANELAFTTVIGERLDAAILVQSHATVDMIGIVTKMLPFITAIVKKDISEFNRLKASLTQDVLDGWTDTFKEAKVAYQKSNTIRDAVQEQY